MQEIYQLVCLNSELTDKCCEFLVDVLYCTPYLGHSLLTVLFRTSPEIHSQFTDIHLKGLDRAQLEIKMCFQATSSATNQRRNAALPRLCNLLSLFQPLSLSPSHLTDVRELFTSIVDMIVLDDVPIGRDSIMSTLVGKQNSDLPQIFTELLFSAERHQLIEKCGERWLKMDQRTSTDYCYTGQQSAGCVATMSHDKDHSLLVALFLEPDRKFAWHHLFLLMFSQRQHFTDMFMVTF